MNINLFPRTGFAVVMALCLALLGYGYYSQYALGFEPCPLCILQRGAFFVMALGALLGLVHGSRGGWRWVHGAVVFAGGVWGLATAGRHLWLQSLPADQVPECGPGFDFMVEYFSLGEAIASAFTGSGECAEVDWSFLGLAMPAWTLIWYVVLMLITALTLRKK
ncbi:MAG: disulfide bond formation protein B [Wenzhouxiangellaceae bacterium]|jgi:disulfide bond formation protein DsbB|nr:disulfide bond formation protein B [Wenzhouxiangellaceae bacterium]MBS3746701.1 disulfide bond formation protein B [Wenzhouxiangellaceae bacterium]MBS3822667.1 disulfide bond formation protein B [Wenzhouxiangellaceae bacterium]